MNEESSGILVGEEGIRIHIRVEGRGTHLNSHLLKEYLLGCADQSDKSFHIDFSQCVYMDSTFLGMLAGIGIKVKERTTRPIQLLNLSERVLGMIQGLGIDHLFEMQQQTSVKPDLTALKGSEISKEAKSKEMLEAHENLTSIAPSNQAKFKDVISLLKEKVRKTDPL